MQVAMDTIILNCLFIDSYILFPTLGTRGGRKPTTSKVWFSLDLIF